MANRFLAGLSVGMSLIAYRCGNSGPSVQTGKKVNDDLVVTLDNPDFTELGVELTPAQTRWNGTMAREIDATSGGTVSLPKRWGQCILREGWAKKY